MSVDQIDTRAWVNRLQRFAPVHNPAFPGYRRTLQPMPRCRPHWPRIAMLLAAAGLATGFWWGVAWLVGGLVG